MHKEVDDETRFPFQRDRDRIIHTQAFRRLKGKTQVFVTGDNNFGTDHYRTRLTHTLEVAILSRDMARTLGLNEDLAESIALAHDLGHPPFGHAGEEALDQWMRDHGETFEHNAQSLRLVTVLESHSSQWKGLNLNREILEGLQKHRTPHDQTGPDHDHLMRSLSLEAQIVNLADEIAYTAHDTEDGLKALLFTAKDLETTALGREALRESGKRWTSVRGAIIHALVMDLITMSEKNLTVQGIRSLAQVYKADHLIIAWSGVITEQLQELRAFLWEHMYKHPSVQGANEHGKKIVISLCGALEKNPSAKVLEFQKRGEGTGIEAIKDYVSGMTDEYATRSIKMLEETKYK